MPSTWGRTWVRVKLRMGKSFLHLLTPKLSVGIKLAVRLEFSMPLDPKDCRRQALQCVRLAQTSASPQVRLHYANLAKTWLTLAGDLEDLDAQTRREEDRIGGPAQLASVYRPLPVS
jgi:hypothetical protein